MPSVLITGARAPAALELARSFARAGWRVHTADTFRWTVCAGSRAVLSHHVVPGPRVHFQAFCRRLEELTAELATDLIVPTCEEVFYLAAWGDRRVFAPDSPLLRQLHSKWEFLQLAEDCGAEIPDSGLLARIHGGARGQVFKREFSRFGGGTYIDKFPSVLPGERWIVQEKLSGQELSSYAVAIAGELTAWALYAPVWRIRGAASVCFRPVHDEQALEFARVFAAKTGLTGQFGFDFIRSGRRLYVLECNPRATSGVHLVGPELATCFRPRTLVQAAREQRAVKAAMLLALPAPSQAGAFVRDFWNTPDIVAIRGDRAPALGLGAHLLEAGWRALAGRQTIQAASTRDLEWDGEPIGVV